MSAATNAPPTSKLTFALRHLRRSLRLNRDDKERADVMRGALKAEPWCLEVVDTKGGELSVAGWALPRVGWTGLELPIVLWNGQPFEDVTHIRRADIAHRIWQREYAEFSGFACKTRTDRSALWRNGYLTLSLKGLSSKWPRGYERTWHYRNPQFEMRMPDAQKRIRAFGTDDEFAFRLTGATDFWRLAHVAQRLGRRPISAFRSVLDCGVGCGRIARYAWNVIGQTGFTGCDTDEANVQWCRHSLPGTYSVISSAPPTSFPTASFDLIYGISLFADAPAEFHEAWLKELQRLLRPDGLALVTVQGETAIDFGGLAVQRLIRLKAALHKEGCAQEDGAENELLPYRQNHKSYYSQDYIRQKWGRTLDVTQIIPGYIMNDDLVCLQRK